MSHAFVDILYPLGKLNLVPSAPSSFKKLGVAQSQVNTTSSTNTNYTVIVKIVMGIQYNE